MLLVVVEESKATRKKEVYRHELNVDNVYTAHSIREAINFLKNNQNSDLSVIINIVLIEEFDAAIEELKEFARSFRGIVILKVKPENEIFALNLLKENLITEFYVTRGDEKEDLESLKKSFNLAVIKRKFNLISKKFEETINQFEKKIGK